MNFRFKDYNRSLETIQNVESEISEIYKKALSFSIYILLRKVKTLHKYNPVAIWMAFSTNIYLTLKWKNSAFWNISNIGHWCNSILLNISYKSNRAYSNTKFYGTCKFKRLLPKLEEKIHFLIQSLIKN